MEESGTNQHLYNGFGNSTARAFELAVTPALFGFLGHLLDRALGTSPLFLIIFVILCVIGMGLRMYYGYNQSMAEHEANLPWANRGHGGADVGDRADVGGNS